MQRKYEFQDGNSQTGNTYFPASIQHASCKIPTATLISTTICGKNPSAPFVRSGFLVSYRIRLAMKTTATRTAPHLTYI